MCPLIKSTFKSSQLERRKKLLSCLSLDLSVSMCDKPAWGWWCHCRGDPIGRADHWPGQHDRQSDRGAAGRAGQEEPYRHSNHPPTTLRALQGGFRHKPRKGERDWNFRKRTDLQFLKLLKRYAHVRTNILTVWGRCNCSSCSYWLGRVSFLKEVEAVWVSQNQEGIFQSYSLLCLWCPLFVSVDSVSLLSCSGGIETENF